MGEGAARAITIASIVLTAASLAVAVFFARKRSRIRVGFDLARAVVGVAAILVMAEITQVTTPGMAIAVAIAIGLGLGFAQGSSLEVSAGESGFYATRGPVGIALWGIGILTMQAAGIAARTGTVRIGQTIAWFSACLGIGLMIGRNGSLQNLRRAAAGAGAAVVVAALTLPAIAVIGGSTTPAAAQTPQLSEPELCGLVVTLGPGVNAGSYIEDSDWFSYEGVVWPTAWCATKVWFLEQSGDRAGFWVFQFASDADAATHFAFRREENDKWADTGSSGASEVIPLSVGTEAWAWRRFGVDEIVMILAPPFVLQGGAMDREGVETVPAYQQVLEPMVATIDNIEAHLRATTTDGGNDKGDSASPVDGGEDGADVGLVSGTDGSEGVGVARPPLGDADEPIEPEDAAGQAIAGLIAAAAIGLISWAEAAAEIGQILSGTRNSSLLDPKPGPGIEKPLEPDPESVKEDPATKQRTDPCAFELDRFRKALAKWQWTQSQISALENEYALTTNQIESQGESDFLGAAFDVAMLAVDIRRGGQTPSSGVLRATVDSWGQSWARSVSSQMIQRAAAGQPFDGAAIGDKAAVDATGVPALTEDGNPASGAFGTFVSESITRLLAANRSYDYLKFMDTLAEPGAIADPEVMKLIERSSFESFQERIGPWVGVVCKYVDFWHKNQKWGEGVERRAAMRQTLLTPIRQRIDELKGDLEYLTIQRDGWQRDLASCRIREETR